MERDNRQNLKVEKLMVGDWVNFITPKGEVEKHKVALQTLINMEKSEYLCKHIEPIPITLEILKKNGFEKSYTLMGEKFRFSDIEDNGCEILFFFEDNHFKHIRVLSDTASVEKIAKEINVHELQHALRFCEIEKEIAL